MLRDRIGSEYISNLPDGMPHNQDLSVQNDDMKTNCQLEKRTKLQSVNDKIRNRAKRALSLGGLEDLSNRDAHNAALQEINESPAFNSTKFLHDKNLGTSSRMERAISKIQGTMEILTSPKESIKAQVTRSAAGKLAKSRPHLSRQADLDFLHAHDSLSKIERSGTASDDEDDAARRAGDIHAIQKKIDDLEGKRESMRVAWMTGRHVQRVQVVQKEPDPFPDEGYFEKLDDCGAVKFQWPRWLAVKLLHHSHHFTAQYIDDFEELPFNIDAFRRYMERLIIVSAPFQTFISEVRGIYRWESPVSTIKWMLLYVFLWKISHIMTFAYGSVIYMAVKNYYYPSSVQSLRDGIQRSLDRGATAFKIGELMDKHGNNDWLEPLMDDLGPYIQLQVADLASILEICYNFYQFESPFASACTLFLFGSIFLVCLVTSAEFSLKIFWFIVGLTFFVCWPISSLYPKYRLLVSPIRWVFWGVPTHAEWSFAYLQRRAMLAQEALATEAIDNSDAESFETASTSPCPLPAITSKKDLISFGCTYHHQPGRLILSNTGLRFQASSLLSALKTSNRVSFEFPFPALVEMTKQNSSLNMVAGIKKLELRFWVPVPASGHKNEVGDEGKEVRILLGNMRERDKAFNAIIGFSGLRWQALQERRKVEGKSKGEKGENAEDA
ncbi:hypothetical protein PVAG01_11389 [Phlyctema vagabunda]|uniref:GRAM domain-containing protein n=1 Tax=Phlyctema vagabunda TaxID=108571 RepID=A0ABR4P257_9HELO